MAIEVIAIHITEAVYRTDWTTPTLQNGLIVTQTPLHHLLFLISSSFQVLCSVVNTTTMLSIHILQKVIWRYPRPLSKLYGFYPVK